MRHLEPTSDLVTEPGSAHRDKVSAPSPLSITLSAAVALAAAIGARWALDPLIGDTFPVVTLFGAVAYASWKGGWFPAAVIAVAGYVACTWLFIEPRGTIKLANPIVAVGALAYAFTCAIIVGFGEELRLQRTAAREAELRRAEQSSVLQRTLGGIGDAVITTDANGAVTFLNGVAESLTGWTTAEARGRPLDEVFHIVDERDGAVLQSPAAEALKLGKVVDLANHASLRSRSGAAYAIEDSAAPITLQSGKIIGAVLVFRDVGSRRRAQRELRESEQLFRTIGEAVPDFLWMTDGDGRPIYQNPAWRAYVGLTSEEFAQRGWQVLHPPEDVPALTTAWKQASGSGTAFSMEARVLRHDGAARWFYCRTVPIADDTGRVVRWVGTMTDIDELKVAEATIAESSGRKDEFLALLSHELRNPLAPLRNALQVLRLQNVTGEAARPLYDMMDRQLSHLIRLVDDLLEISRITTGSLELRRESLDLNAIARTAIEAAQPAISRAGHELVFAPTEERVVVDGDAVRLSQILVNLLTNAARYTPTPDKISMRIHVSSGEVAIAVEDAGVGIAHDELPHLFEMFRRGRHTNLAQEGLGVGLALATRLAEMHGGRLVASSAGPGSGSTFTLHLPLAARMTDAEPRAVTRGSALRNLRVVIVDDNVDAADSLGILLAGLGARTAVAHSGREALELVDTHDPSLVLLDLGMPDMDGYDTLRCLRQREGGRERKVVALTGWGQEHDRRRVKDAGFDGHLVKPVDLEALEAVAASIDRSLPTPRPTDDPALGSGQLDG